ncbi:Cof-type HAD-IIB family hydrolase [Ruminococcus sp. NK3A76]|uniref:Cof-type HAD-IIB family hydrolase n=1 Tax=Ruminococcus sp. NK3A76 TaxID=877411 RepID=UPI00048F5700|nr:Cof-type HAD-IIB family hydrolase [Ruminococcus sp. NK3A76]
MDKSILFFDIDGTVVSEDENRFIPESTKAALKAARDNGHIIMVNTGRTILIIEDRIKQLGFSGYVCGCGTNIILDSKELLRNRNDPALCLKIRDLLEKLKIPAIYESAESMRYNSNTYIHPELENMLTHFRSQQFNVNEAHDEGFYFDKFFCWAHDDSRFDIFERELSKDFQVIRRGDSPGIMRCEIVPHGFSKATGMKFMLDELGIKHENSYAFGDSTNDLPMLEYAAHSAAMGGCPDALKDKVEFVTDTLYNDGLAKAMERFGLI